ncbi:hypothetical protein [Streptomyces bacillaris]|uniref:hypothetical protein n=1 Tax=Streptomyces bacillaris TaxID=68179 RepID=UPI00363AFB6F
MICVDCDRVIVGPSELVVAGDSMSGARPDAYAHPPGAICRPKTPRKAALRKGMSATPRPASSRR